MNIECIYRITEMTIHLFQYWRGRTLDLKSNLHILIIIVMKKLLILQVKKLQKAI